MAPNTPRDSHAMGTKKYLAPREEYFFLFWDSASAASKLGPLSAAERCDGAKVSLHVASDKKGIHNKKYKIYYFLILKKFFCFYFIFLLLLCTHVGTILNTAYS